MSALLVAAGTVLLWPLLARHGRGVAGATVIALVFGTAVYGLAIGTSWVGPLGFAVGAALVRVAAARLDVPHSRPLVWAVAGVISLGVLVAGGAGPEDVLDGLFSSWGGLLYWSPILWLGLAGCLRDRGTGPAGALAPALLVAAAVGAVTTDLGPYRGARFAPVLPILALGLARAFDDIRTLALHRPLVPVAALIAALAAGNGLLMAQYKDGLIPKDDTVSFPRVAGNAAAAVSRAMGSPTAWPASWIFAARNGVAPGRYDLLGGVDLMSGGMRGLNGVIDIGDLRTDDAVLQGGWSVRHPCGAGVCRAVSGTAALLAPIRDPRDLDVVVSAEGTGTLTMAVNGVPVLAAPLAGDSRPLFVHLPRARLRRGLNAVVFSTSPDGQAAIDRLVFAPARDSP